MVVLGVVFFALHQVPAFSQRLLDDADGTFVNKNVHLAQAVAAASYQPVELGVDGFIRDGHLINNWSAFREDLQGRCPAGSTRGDRDSKCHVPCKDGYEESEGVCKAVCKVRETTKGDFCTDERSDRKKDEYERPWGSHPGCHPDSEKNGLLCYPNCESGYYGVGPVCWEHCPEGYADHGATCFKWLELVHWKSTYGRGFGWSPNYCGHLDGTEFSVSRCFTKCKPGYGGTLRVCTEICGEGWVDDGDSCKDYTYKRTQYAKEVAQEITYLFEKEYDQKACKETSFTGHSADKFIVVRNHNDKISVFAFRGVNYMKVFTEIYTDLAEPQIFKLDGKNAGVLPVLLNNWEGFKDEVKEQLSKTPNDHKVIITGHGIGAALSFLAAPYFSVWGRPADAVIPFSSPLIGDGEFAARYNDLVGCDKTSHIHAIEDAVPMVPTLSPYQLPCSSHSRSTEWSGADAFDLFRGVGEVLKSIPADNATCSPSA